MTSTDFERFKENKKAELAKCLRGSGWLNEDMSDMPGVSDADSLREQFYDSIGQPINAWFAPPDEIDWKGGLEKELIAYSREVWDEWMERKRTQDKAEATPGRKDVIADGPIAPKQKAPRRCRRVFFTMGNLQLVTGNR